MRRIYIWEQPGWPSFTFDAERLVVPLGAARHAQGEVQGAVRNFGQTQLDTFELDARTDDGVETSAIEGEVLSRPSVRSSVAQRLGIDAAGAPTDARAEGVAEMIFDATRNHADPLTVDRLFRWQAGLYPVELGAPPGVALGRFRDDALGPMQVVSGRIDAPTVHYEAPPATCLQDEVRRFTKWFNASHSMDSLIFAGLAHLWFITIHPLDDGNGRVARAIADMALSRDEQSPYRYVSMTAQIAREKQSYYDQLERAQRSGLDVTDWLTWFLACYLRATQATLKTIDNVLARSRYWSHAERFDLSPRQRKAIARLLEDTWHGFLTAPKYAKLTSVSTDTAQRDIADLLQKGLLLRNPGGSKKTSYSLRRFDVATPTER